MIVTIKNQKDIEKYQETSTIPELSSLQAHRPDVFMYLQVLQKLVKESNHLGKPDPKIENLCLKLLNNNLMYFAEASKVEIIVILAKVRQFQGKDFIDEFYSLVQQYFNTINA